MKATNLRSLNLRSLVPILMICWMSAEADPRINEFDSLPPEEALKLYADTNEPPELKIEMMRAALRDKRMDLITLLYNEHSSFHQVITAASEMPASEFKDQIVLMMLRSQSAFWYRPDSPLESDGSRAVEFDNVVEPFVGVIGKYLPSLSINQETFATKSKRIELATNLEAAMTGNSAPPMKNIKRPDKQRLSPEGQIESQARPPEAGSASKLGKTNSNPLENSTGSAHLPWPLILGFFALLLLAWFAWLKARKSNPNS